MDPNQNISGTSQSPPEVSPMGATEQPMPQVPQAPQIPQQPEPIQTQTPMQPETPSSKGKSLKILLIILLVVLLGAGAFFLMNYLKPDEDLYTTPQDIFAPPVIEDPEQTFDTPESYVECEVFPEMLETCTPYVCEFTHSLTGDLMVREVIGLIGDTCRYTEELPDGNRMDCDYTEDMRIAVAAAHKISMFPESSFGVPVDEILDNQEENMNIDELTQTALDTGQCVILDN